MSDDREITQRDQFAASQAEQPMKDGELEKSHAAQKAHAMDAMARDHDSRAKLLREGANAIRAKAGLPEHV